jgi:hypothetical protein
MAVTDDASRLKPLWGNYVVSVERDEMTGLGQVGHAGRAVRKALKVACSVLCAGGAYFIWMAAFIFLDDVGGRALRALLWLAAPVATALGFAVGAALCERLTEGRRERFRGVYLWPLAGCSIGAVVVFPFGPMLIVFGMFLMGTASMILRELVRQPL